MASIAISESLSRDLLLSRHRDTLDAYVFFKKHCPADCEIVLLRSYTIINLIFRFNTIKPYNILGIKVWGNNQYRIILRGSACSNFVDHEIGYQEGKIFDGMESTLQEVERIVTACR